MHRTSGRRLWAGAALAALAAGCASYTQLAPDDRRALEQEMLAGQRYLRLSYNVTPFFGDGTKKLLTAVSPDEVRLLAQPSGEPVSPGPVEKVIPVGTRARVLKMEFPTAWAVVQRVTYTPRFLPWIYLEVEGEPPDLPLILALTPKVETQASFLAEVDRYLSRTDPAALLEQWPEKVRTAVKNKTALIDMPSEALEMAWGYPEIKRITFDAEGKKKESWIYPGGKRTVQMEDGRVSAIEEPEQR